MCYQTAGAEVGMISIPPAGFLQPPFSYDSCLFPPNILFLWVQACMAYQRSIRGVSGPQRFMTTATMSFTSHDMQFMAPLDRWLYAS
jgi:hypothetical protein